MHSDKVTATKAGSRLVGVNINSYQSNPTSFTNVCGGFSALGHSQAFLKHENIFFLVFGDVHNPLAGLNQYMNAGPEPSLLKTQMESISRKPSWLRHTTNSGEGSQTMNM
jgi:hypothetical protein